MRSTHPITEGIVVKDDYILKLPSGETKLVSVVIGTPYRSGNFWHCPCELRGIDDRYPDFPGVTSLHALAAAIWIVVSNFADQVRTGQKFYPSEEAHIEDAEALSETEIWQTWNGLFEARDATMAH